MAQTMAQTQPLPVYRAPPQNQNLTQNQNQQFIQPRQVQPYGYVNAAMATAAPQNVTYAPVFMVNQGNNVQMNQGFGYGKNALVYPRY